MLWAKQELEMPGKEPTNEALMTAPMLSTFVALAHLHASGSMASAEAGALEFVSAISPFR